MKGVILAGGLGTRLRPLTHITNKHLLPVYDKPMIYYPIRTLVTAGVTEIMIVTGGPYAGHFMRVLKNGDELGITHLEYAYQENEGGIAHALALAESFADEEPVAVILGDNTTDASIKSAVDTFDEGARIFVRQVSDPQRFGVPTFDPRDSSKVINIVEKPKNPSSNYVVVGLYMYDDTVFDRIKKLKPSDRGELEVTDLNNSYIEDGQMKWSELRGFWSDAGTFDSLFYSNEYWAKAAKRRIIANVPRQKLGTVNNVSRIIANKKKVPFGATS